MRPRWFPIDEAIRRAAYRGDKEILGKAASIPKGAINRVSEPFMRAARVVGFGPTCAGGRWIVLACQTAGAVAGTRRRLSLPDQHRIARDATRCGIDTSIRSSIAVVPRSETGR